MTGRGEGNSTGRAPLPPLARIPPDLRSLADYEARARDHLAPDAWDHIQAGSGAGLTLHENRVGFDRWHLLPRTMADLRGGGTAISLFGRSHAAPVLLGPVAYQRLAHPDGELATAQAAAALGTGMVASTLASATIEEIATAALAASHQLGTPPPPLWFQLYLQPDREDSLSLVRRAEGAGYEAIVLTVDAAIKLAGITLPAGVDAVNLAGLARPAQTANVGGRILFGTPLIDAAPRWDDLVWLREATRLPIIVKGMVLGEDADRAMALGANGLILSNHGGRVLDGLPGALDMLPSVVGAVNGRGPVLIDGGVRTGTDVVKALALGAAAVLLGRPQMHGLAIAGTAGVAHVLHLLRAELEMAMALLGCARVDDITPDRVQRAR